MAIALTSDRWSRRMTARSMGRRKALALSGTPPHPGRPFGPAKPATMKDVATKAGVAQSTVSRVLNDAPSSVAIAPTTRDRIFAAARDLSYARDNVGPHRVDRCR
jgi:hypothetical protein